MERGRFIRPSPADGILAITAAQLAYMLDGIDWRNPVRTWRPEVAGWQFAIIKGCDQLTHPTLEGSSGDRRWLTRDTTLLIHGRRMMRNVHLEGPLGSCRRVLEEIIADIDNGLRVEDEGFAEPIVGSAVSLDDIRSKSYGAWYLSAAQALEVGLVAGLV